jgi:CBS-domain-containing membrane protein
MMIRKHAVMPHTALDAGTRFREPPHVPPAERLNAPALGFMTDFNLTTPITTDAEVPIDRALDKMRREAVRLLLVIDGENRIIGKITSMEIEGEEPIALAQERRMPRSEILVKHIMSPQSKVQVLTYESVANAEVGHVVATLNYLKLKHLLVVETDPVSKSQIVRGVISRARIGAHLRMNLNLVDVGPQTLAEMAHDKP